MSIKKLNDELAQCTEEISVIKAELDAQRINIVDKAKPIVRAAIQSKIEEDVKKKAEHTVVLGREKLSDLKSQLADALSRSDQFLEDTFQDDQYWIYATYVLPEKYPSDYMPYDKRELVTKRIHEGLKIVYGLAGAILIKYGYAEPGYAGDHHSLWSVISYAKNIDEQKVKALSIPQLPKEFVELISSHTETIEKLHKKLYELRTINRNVAEYDAESLWDSL